MIPCLALKPSQNNNNFRRHAISEKKITNKIWSKQKLSYFLLNFQPLTSIFSAKILVYIVYLDYRLRSHSKIFLFLVQRHHLPDQIYLYELEHLAGANILQIADAKGLKSL